MARRVRTVIVLLAGLWLAQLLVSVPASAATSVTTKMTLPSGRFFYLQYRPGDNTPKPLIIALHGFGGSAVNVQGVTGLNAWADARGNDVNIAYAQGENSEWNAGSSTNPGCCGGAQTDDVGYLRDVALRVFTTTPTTLIYVFGFSNGGMMAVRAVCEAPFLFFAAATVEAGPAVQCRFPVRVVAIHQSRDMTVRYAGGPVTVGGSTIGYTLPDQAGSFPPATSFDLHLCSLPTTTSTYHSWTSPCWPTTNQVDDLLWSSITALPLFGWRR